MNRAATLVLAPLCALYGAAITIRRALYQRGILRVHEVGVPVISVGNITTGGTGKTPLVEWIARELARNNHKVCILTRGYGRKNRHRRVVVSRGGRVLANAEDAGDEALLLAERLNGQVSVISDADRVAAAQWAKKESRWLNAFVLDDGFQHLRIARELNIVTVDANNPWGNGKLLPAGTLRESPCELSRADCIVITRAEDPEQSEKLRQEIRKLNLRAPIFCSRMKIGGWRGQNSKRIEIGSRLKPTPAAAFCGIGNPESFFDQLRRDGHALCHTKAFGDHHAYSQANIDELLRESMAHGAEALLTTAKDEVKLRSLHFTLPCYIADLVIEIENDEALQALIAGALRKR